MSAVHDEQQPAGTTTTTDVVTGEHPAQPRPEHLQVIDPDSEPPLPPVKERITDFVTNKALPRCRSMFVPPDFITQDRPSLKKVHAYGKHGQQVPDEGLLRLVARAWSWFAMYHEGRGALRGWLMSNPSRACVFVALLITTALIPEGRMVLTWLLWPAHTVIELLTDL
ncbi:hypothetical protein BS329_15555 [Amycolatopsis coloradensis]|uniref:Uncharacterized protein n=1 Tax=Amycolatopsis coloradensis TaxID=76021 RepID=A0A1R0KU76_9PSEU|nr:hypothetical protein [Amycolatopsis coloradensis]OLZ51679.1 hypothetical protein BS329_15555 [Amycolatopsis coloradensis]